MKKYYLMISLAMVSAAAFSQSQSDVVRESAKSAKGAEMAAKADTMLVDKKAIADEPKKKKPRRDKSHKECSRMKS